MNRLFERLRKIRPGYLGKPVNVKKIILAQKELAQNRNAPLPKGFLEFLHRCNGISYDGAGIFGIAPEGRIFLDIVPANQMSPFSGCPELVILGCDEFDYLAYNAECRRYQIIDKEDLEVLEEYSDIEPAILHILKI